MFRSNGSDICKAKRSVKEKFMSCQEEWYRPQCQWTMCKLYYDFEVLCHAYCHACLIFVRYQSWLFSLFFKKCVVYKGSNIHDYKGGTSLKSPCHHHQQVRNLCSVQSKVGGNSFFLAQVTFSSISLTISKKFCRCVYHKGGTKNSFPLLSLKPIALLFCVSSM